MSGNAVHLSITIESINELGGLGGSGNVRADWPGSQLPMIPHTMLIENSMRETIEQIRPAQARR